MPIVAISILKNRTPEEKKSINTAIHNSLIEAFKIPENDFNHRILEFDKENWIIPGGKSDKFIQIEISAFTGRSREAKKNLYRNIVENLRILGINPDDIFILINEQPLVNWGVRGGQAADEIDLGFEIKI